ncbi:MAG TPA: type II toxin-antitoxin system RelE/ParE family toxin [Flavobacteriaceae bacterium]|jgi:plasmid stabilization system protein ParE|nr:type II toxin-antitoxin system RelE/ParE family toxin [Flavobacteriaceae bacterium]|tara:strand:+ start:849 stop:1130 length:282 start_codon:yes stop_codon:yes gene_type:complete
MKIKVLKSFSLKLADQVEYIAEDKPQAARKFKKDILKTIKELEALPYKHRKSIYFDDENIRDLVFKGYTIVYRVKPKEECIEVFGLLKYEDKL